MGIDSWLSWRAFSHKRDIWLTQINPKISVKWSVVVRKTIHHLPSCAILLFYWEWFAECKNVILVMLHALLKVLHVCSKIGKISVKFFVINCI